MDFEKGNILIEIKLVFRAPKDSLRDSWFDLYIDGKLEKNVKRFSIDVSNSDVIKENGIAAEDGFSYKIEKYINLLKDAEERHE